MIRIFPTSFCSTNIFMVTTPAASELRIRRAGQALWQNSSIALGHNKSYMLTKNRSELNDFSDAIQHEWLETNGLGGWSGSTVLNCHSRRYHGLLVAATNPPTERMNLLSKLDETIITSDGRFELG